MKREGMNKIYCLVVGEDRIHMMEDGWDPDLLK